MAATVVWAEANGVGPDYNTVTEVRFCNTDVHNPVLTYPCVKPSAGFNYSFWKSLFLSISGTYTRINNVLYYSDGAIGFALGTDGGVFVGIRDADDNGLPTGSYQQATGAGDSGYWMDDVTNGHAYYKAQTAVPANVEDYTSGGGELTVDSTNHDNAEEKTKGLVLQAKIDDDATRGVQAAETQTMSFDEI